MQQPSSASAREPVPLSHVNIALLEDAARDLEEFRETIMAPGHWPSWNYTEEVPDGLALCVGCWRPITASQLGVEPCPALAHGGRNWRST
jgi:hypothetical protein